MLRLSTLSLARNAVPRRVVSLDGENIISIHGRAGLAIRYASTKEGPKNNDEPKAVPSLTLEEAYNMRADLENSAAKARIRMDNEEKVKQGKIAAKREKMAGARKNTGRAVPHLFGTDMVLFRKVLAELNLTASSAFDLDRTKGSWMEYQDMSKTADGEGGFDHYRAIYLDSIPSFARILANDPATVDIYTELSRPKRSKVESFKQGVHVDTENNEEKLSRAEQLLDALSDAGFSSIKWAKQHRRVPKQKQQCERYRQLLQRKEDEIKEAEKYLMALNEKLEQAERCVIEVSEAPSRTDSRSTEKIQEPDDSNKAEAGALKNAFDNMTSFFRSFSTPEVSQEEEKEPNKKLTRQEKKVNKIRNKLNFIKKRKLGLTRQLERIQAEVVKYEPALSDSQYDAANKIAREVLSELCPAFAVHMKTRHAKMIEQYRVLDAQTDLTKPHEWYPRTRLTRRKIIYHGGPTNSGKTYMALQRLRDAGKGLYLAPLRLLAAEVYETLTSQGVYTNLLTGQEKRMIPFSTHSSATVEMACTDEEYDVVVIDEIQMISDPFRGSAWTRALLGAQAKEIHVCGGLEAHDLVKKIAELCGDEFELSEYARFSSLSVAEKSISRVSNKAGSYKAVQPGDCVVAFSRNDIFAIKREIEKNTDHKCCVIYGTLPPQIRADQARKFNDPNSGFDVLVASDAIGMGLNLNIRRIIFNSLFKSNGEAIVRLDHSSVKQIAGRAGRRNSPFPDGEVTCRDPADMEYLRKCMSTEIAQIEKGGLIPTAEHFEMFSAAAEKYDFGDDIKGNLHRVIRQFSEMARLRGHFFMCRKSHLQLVAEWMDEMPLSIQDKYVFCMSPVNERCNRSSGLLKGFAAKHASDEVFGLKMRSFAPKRAKGFDDLSRLCSMHNELELFLWLDQKFTGNAVERITAEQVRERTIDLINRGLTESDRLRLSHDYIRRDKKLRKEWKEERQAKSALILEGDSDDFRDFVHHLDEADDLVDCVEVEKV